jgi:hypothetical protein
MRARSLFQSFLVAALGLILGCDKYALDTAWRSEDYRLVWIDAPAETSLVCKASDGTSLHLVGPTVFSIGADQKYIVAAQHPAVGFGFDRSVTRYFIVERIQRSGYADREKGVRGPLSKEEFERLTTTLSLPKFSKTFDDLK